MPLLACPVPPTSTAASRPTLVCAWSTPSRAAPRFPVSTPAGEVTGGFHGFGYMSATAFGKALIHGVVAAQSLGADAE